MITWTTNCIDTLDESQCEVYKQGVEELWTQNENIFATLTQIEYYGQDILEKLTEATTLFYLIIILAVVYIIIRWIFRLISDTVLGF